MKKINGFTQKSHPYQIMAYIFFSAMLVAYFLIIFPLSSSQAKVIGATLEVLIGISVVISGYVVTVIDPSDTYRGEALKAREEGKPYTPPSTEFRCSIEDVYVHHSSKHCRSCGRCTEGFDHHCKWINNDVGKKNYKSFLALIWSIVLFFAHFIIFGALVTASYVKDSNFSGDNIYFYPNKKENILAGLVILWVLMAITSVFFLLVTNLALLHIFLIKKGLTTFQYITLVEERKQNRVEMEIALKAMGGQKHTCLDFVLCLKNKKKNSIQNNASPTEEGRDDTKERANNSKKYTDKSRTHSDDSESDSDSDSDSSDSEDESEVSAPEVEDEEGQQRIFPQTRVPFENLGQVAQRDNVQENSEVTRKLISETFQIKNKAREAENISLLNRRNLMISLEMIDHQDLRKLVSPKQSTHHNKAMTQMHSFEFVKYYEEGMSPLSNRDTTRMKKYFEPLSARDISPKQKSLLLQELEATKRTTRKKEKEKVRENPVQQDLGEKNVHLAINSDKTNNEDHEERQELNIEVLN